MKLDVISNDIFLRTSEYGGHLAGMVSEELEEPYAIPAEYPLGKYLLVFDPLDGSSNIDVNAPVGSIFSVLKAPRKTQAGERRGFSAAGIAAAVRRLRHLRRDHHAGAHPGARRARLHAGSRLRRIRPHPPEHDHPAGDQRVRHQRLERALLGAAGETLRGRMPAGPRRRPRQGLQHALDRLAGRGSAPNPDPRRAVHVSARTPRRRASPGACGCSTRPIPWR